jgi:PAS domain S-box-containing protein
MHCVSLPVLGGPIMLDETIEKQEQLRICRDRYQKLFSRNIAGIVTTTPEGRIVDCNQMCATLLGFESSLEVKADPAWEFYFHPTDREARITPTSVVESDGEIVRLRHRTGKPVLVKATRVVLSHRSGQPELIQATFIDITQEQEQAQPVCELTSQHGRSGEIESVPCGTSGPEIPGLAAVIEEIGILVGRLNESVQPNALERAGKAEVRQIVAAIDQMKMSLAQLEILRLTSSFNASTVPDLLWTSTTSGS